jgi:hypothetical protein
VDHALLELVAAGLVLQLAKESHERHEVLASWVACCSNMLTTGNNVAFSSCAKVITKHDAAGFTHPRCHFCNT